MLSKLGTPTMSMREFKLCCRNSNRRRSDPKAVYRGQTTISNAKTLKRLASEEGKSSGRRVARIQSTRRQSSRESSILKSILAMTRTV